MTRKEQEQHARVAKAREAFITLAALWGACQLADDCITDEEDEAARKISEDLAKDFEPWEIEMLVKQIVDDALKHLGIKRTGKAKVSP